MDAHSFRILAGLFIPLLKGARIDKIYGPLPHLTVFHCFSTIGKLVFAVQSDKQDPKYFFQFSPLPNPPTPTPAVMRLRKYLVNAHFGEGYAEITTRSVCFPIMRKNETICWLMCSPSQGISLHGALPDGFPRPVLWPEPHILAGLLRPDRINDPATWLAYPILTPSLRGTIPFMDPQEALALMVDLEAGGGDLFFYGSAPGQPTCYYAWPLPAPLLEERGLIPVRPEDVPVTPRPGVPGDILVASVVDEQSLQHSYADFTHKDDRKADKRLQKRMHRKKRALEQEEKRLQSMIKGQSEALLIQENLWQLNPEAKFDNISLTSVLPSGETVSKTVSLNPVLTIRENMLDLFKKAEKAKRGLRILQERQKEMETLNPAEAEKTTTPQNPLSGATGKEAGRISAGQENISTQYSSLHNWINLLEIDFPSKQSLKDIAAFQSSDGYTILRGKNAQGNRQLIKLSKPHDIWLHVQDGPSAHAVIKRNHAQDQIPEQTISEAACLVAEKSWLRESSSANVMLALVKNVQPIKGAAAGTVKVDKILRTVYIKRVASG